MDHNRPALLILLALYFIFLTIGMGMYGDMLQDFAINSDYQINGVTYDNETTTTSISQGEGTSFLKSLRVGITNIPIYLNMIFFILPSILLILVIASFFTAD